MSHPVPQENEDSLNAGVYAALLALTVATLAATRLGEGRLLAVSIALIIASAKAALIGFYFMDLRRERALIYGALAIAALAVLILMVGLLPDVTFFRG